MLQHAVNKRHAEHMLNMVSVDVMLCACCHSLHKRRHMTMMARQHSIICLSMLLTVPGLLLVTGLISSEDVHRVLPRETVLCKS